jgi:apolipoprotein N-acyltransferase
VGFLIVLVAACGANGLRIADCGLRIESGNSKSEIRNPKLLLLSLLPAVVALSAAIGYGRWRLADVAAPADAPIVRIALVQGNSLADWKLDDARQRQIMDDYVRLSQNALTKARATGDGRPVALIVWPETMFRVPLYSFDESYQLPPDSVHSKEDFTTAGPKELAGLVAALGTPVLVGIDRIHFEGAENGVRGAAANRQDIVDSEPETPPPASAYNAAVLVDRGGRIVITYDKFHLVMFGEYVPLSRWLPFLKRLSSLTGSVEAGAGPVAMELDGAVYAPNICYETVIPHVIRRQANTLSRDGRRPEILVNVTNDSWYWGSSELEQHLASGVFRAIETRRSLVIAANGGISAWIDHCGRIRAQSAPQQEDVIIADVEKVATASWYMAWGDWFAGACLLGCIVLAAVGWLARRQTR